MENQPNPAMTNMSSEARATAAIAALTRIGMRVLVDTHELKEISEIINMRTRSNEMYKQKIEKIQEKVMTHYHSFYDNFEEKINIFNDVIANVDVTINLLNQTKNLLENTLVKFNDFGIILNNEKVNESLESQTRRFIKKHGITTDDPEYNETIDTITSYPTTKRQRINGGRKTKKNRKIKSKKE